MPKTVSGLRGLDLSAALSGPFRGMILAGQGGVRANHRPGLPERLQLDPPSLNSAKHRIVCCSITSQGSTGSSTHRTAFGQDQSDDMLREGGAMHSRLPEERKWVHIDKSLPQPREASREIGG